MEIKELLAKLQGVRATGKDKFKCLCPAHDDNNPSLQVWLDDNDYIAMKCYTGCNINQILSSIRLEKKDLVTEIARNRYKEKKSSEYYTKQEPRYKKSIKIGSFNNNKQNYLITNNKCNKPKKHIEYIFVYNDENGNYVYELIKFKNKSFIYGFEDDNKNWVNSIKSKKRYLYQLPSLINAIKNNQTVFIVEGEKDVDSLMKLGLVATTNPMGASKPNNKSKWLEDYNFYFKNAKEVILIPDNDAIGYQHVINVYNHLLGIVKNIKFGIFKGQFKEKYDSSDLIKDKYIQTKEDFILNLEIVDINQFIEHINIDKIGFNIKTNELVKNQNQKENHIIQFWSEEPHKLETKYKINDTLFYDFVKQLNIKIINLNTYNNKNYELVQFKGKIICTLNTFNLLTIIKDKIKQAENLFEDLDLNALTNAITKKIEYLFNELRKIFNLIDDTQFELNKNTLNTAYLYYRNNFIEISKSGIKIKSYDELNHYIFESQIIQRDFHLINYYTEDGKHIIRNNPFFKFLLNICSDRTIGVAIINYKLFFNLIISLGYLLDTFKTKSCSKIIFFTDEKLDSNANGRTGKGILCNAIKNILRVFYIDGKQYDPKKEFNFNTLTEDDKIILFDDIEDNFDIRNLFSKSTETFSIVRKHKGTLFLDFNNSPKLAITSNYYPTINGESEKARIHVVELKHYYTSSYQPISEFKKLFFDEWNAEEYNEFDNLIVLILYYYKIYFSKRQNLYQIPTNYIKDLLKLNLSKEFIKYSEKIDFNTEYIFSELFNDFLLTTNKTETEFSKKKFGIQLKILANYFDLEYESKNKRIEYKESNQKKPVKVVNFYTKSY